ncbi:DUF1998 domain-containing protein [Pseudothermotoga thermarum]|uniref:MrfA-like Zn-binding domain-containing protein n=1 Tax=Pseudothermotoga thermarum DSM 5069 TaxID=688269 RepID=F7YTP0_9THEM|nr:DUF1998 domain-containing protein [Pseudothermotoga thermarum]AEH51262.1 hypothetical protein Theth_1190 [Pseudothermotoga thermarum DSM 5069]
MVISISFIGAVFLLKLTGPRPYMSLDSESSYVYTKLPKSILKMIFLMFSLISYYHVLVNRTLLTYKFIHYKIEESDVPRKRKKYIYDRYVEVKCSSFDVQEDSNEKSPMKFWLAKKCRIRYINNGRECGKRIAGKSNYNVIPFEVKTEDGNLTGAIGCEIARDCLVIRFDKRFFNYTMVINLCSAVCKAIEKLFNYGENELFFLVDEKMNLNDSDHIFALFYDRTGNEEIEFETIAENFMDILKVAYDSLNTCNCVKGCTNCMAIRRVDYEYIFDKQKAIKALKLSIFERDETTKYCDEESAVVEEVTVISEPNTGKFRVQSSLINREFEYYESTLDKQKKVNLEYKNLAKILKLYCGRADEIVIKSKQQWVVEKINFLTSSDDTYIDEFCFYRLAYKNVVGIKI